MGGSMEQKNYGVLPEVVSKLKAGQVFSNFLELSKYQKSFVDGIYSGHQMNIGTKLPCC